MLNIEFMITTPGKWSLIIYGQLACVRVEQELKAESTSVSVSMCGSANFRDRSEKMYGGVLKALESESGERLLKKKESKNKPKKLILTLQQLLVEVSFYVQ